MLFNMGQPKLQRLTESDDIEYYLTTFERVAHAYNWPQDMWVLNLAPLPTGKAQSAYASLNMERAKEYHLVKEAILKRYDINEEIYRQRFRGAKKKAEETYSGFGVRLNDMFNKWTGAEKEERTKEEICEMMVMEQLMESMPTDLKIWLKERKSKTTLEVGELADDYVTARKCAKEEQKRCHKCHQIGHIAAKCWNNVQGIQQQTVQSTVTKGGVQWKPNITSPLQQQPRCFNCNRLGHIAMKCPENRTSQQTGQGKANYIGTSEDELVIREELVEYRTLGKVEGKVTELLLDTGCSKTMIDASLVPVEKFNEEKRISMQCAHGDMKQYPIAVVEIEVNGKTYSVGAAVVDGLPRPVLLGRDVKDLVALVLKEDQKRKGSALAVMTRKQRSEKEKEEAINLVKEMVSEAKPKQLVDIFNFEDEIFTGEGKVRKTRGQKKLLKKQWKNKEPNSSVDGDMNSIDSGGKEKLQKLQKTDSSLVKIREMVTEGSAPYEEDDGLIYRTFNPGEPENPQVIRQLVLPREYRKKVLELAHDIPLAGHLGTKKTQSRILQRFFWPGVSHDVKEYCRSCAACQKTSKKAPRAKMQSMPIIDEAFSRIAMDMIGPLDRTYSGNKYILVVCNYATRYPEAIPLRNIDAETTSEAMVEVFTRYGIPPEVLTDQGSNFMAELMQRVLELLQVSHIKTSPYHPQTDGLVERFNGTLKKMLNKFAQEHPKEWDKLIPYLLLAYREVPQESTGFSPFELLFGRHVRGPLDVLKESWETKHKVGDDELTYVTEMREKLASMTELVQENLAKSQDRQKRWYDQKARSRSLEVGQRALVLLPSSNKKLHAAWQGPYVIKRKIGDVNYEVEMHDKKKRQRIFHIDMLKPWNTPENVTYMSILSGKELEGGNECFKNDEIQYPFEMDSEEPKVNPMLNDAQRCQLKNLMQEFKDVFNDIPGRTSLVEHKIDVGDAKPIRQRPYRIPWAQRDAVKRELEMMEHHGIIEESVSEWAQPVVIVPKKDSQEVRICVDFREVNKLAKVVPYPLPRVEDLIDKMAGAKYITTMDLSRGYWQIPLSKDSKEKTAFITPFGLWQFVTMPFGLADAQATC